METFFDWLNTILTIASFFGITYITVVNFFLNATLKVKAMRYYKEIKFTTIVIVCILILSLMASEKPWQKLHYGDTKERVVDVDSSKLKDLKPTAAVDSPSHKMPESKKKADVVFLNPKKPAKTSTVPIPIGSKYDLRQANLIQSPVGDGATLIINEPKQRIADNKIIAEIISHIPNKDIYISLQRRTDDEETLKFAQSIAEELKKRGYKNILMFTIAWGGPNDVTYMDSPELTLKDKKTFHFKLDTDQLQVCLPIK